MNLFEQLKAARIPTPTNLKQIEERTEKQRLLLEWLCRSGRNLTAIEAAEAMNVSADTIKVWFKELQKGNHVACFTTRGKNYYTPTKAELERRKRWTS